MSPRVMAATRCSLAALVAATGIVLGGLVAFAATAGAGGHQVPTSRMLTLHDLPKGWTKTSTKVTETTPQTLIAAISPCLGTTAPSMTGIPSRTRAFNLTDPKGNSYTIFEGVSFFPSTSSAGAVWAVLSAARTPVCTAAAFTQHLASTGTFKRTGLAVSAPVSSKLTPTAFGADTTTFRFHYTIKGSKTIDFTTRILCIGVLQGRYLIELFVTGLSPPSPLLHRVVAAARKHLP